ncbi:uncharacterized protein LOC119397122 [Rhipicephalus sanguineus]|uniref:uncharacterized protein LOC119397122 n=1 Tax=Rhipicephalus sanguineus TaxID=34632 RepID=UPI0020C518E9|nr:uncharacterized protein LOC119397122 [Rhipicephalus sanguineus]
MGTPAKPARARPGVVPSIFVYERNESQEPKAAFSKRPEHEIVRQLLSGDITTGRTPGPSQCSERDQDDIAVEPVHQAAVGLACELGQAVETSPEAACELNHVSDKSFQVRIPTSQKASQANGMKILSSTATQTEPNIVSSGSFSFVSLERSSFLGCVQGRLQSCLQCSYVTLDKSTMDRHLQKHMGKQPCEAHPRAQQESSPFAVSTAMGPFCWKTAS